MGERGTRVLVVDDDAERMRCLLKSVSGGGLHAEAASDYPAVLAACGTGVHDAVLVADHVWGRDGLEVVQSLQRDGVTAPVIVLTRHAGRDVWRAALGAGAADCLRRDGIDADALERAIRSAIRQKRTEHALREHEAWYHRLFESLPQPMFAYDVETLALLDANHAAVEQYGYTRDELLSLTLTDIRPPEEVPRVLEWIRAFKDKPFVAAGCWRHRRKDGTNFEVEIRSNALTWKGRSARVVLARDMTAQRRAEAAERNSAQFVRGVLDSLVSFVSVIGEDGSILAVNHRWRESAAAGEIPLIAGMEGTNYLEVCDESRGDDAPAALADGLRAVLAGQAPAFAQDYPVRREGTRRWFNVQVVPFRGDGPRRAVIKHAEITECKRIEEALRESEARFRGAFDAAAIGMAIVAGDGRFIRVNQSLCQFTGYSEAELLASDVPSITHPDDLAKDLSAFGSLLRGEIRTYRLENRYIHKDGHTIWGLLCVSAVSDARGAPLYVIGEVEDITSRKRNETAIARLLDRLKRLRQLDEAIVSAASPREVAQTALDHLLQLIPCYCGRVDLVDARRGHWTVLATRGLPPKPQTWAPHDPLSEETTTCSATGLPETELSLVMTRAASEQRYTYVRKPLTYKGRLLGGLHLYFEQPGAPDPEQLEVAREVADLLAIALRQARLFRQVRRGRRRLSALSKRLIAAQEAERRRLARELHDEIGQSLTALKLSIQAGAESDDLATRKALAEEGRQFIDQLIDQVRNLSLNLRPSMLDDFGLVSALRWYVDRLARRSGIVARLAVDPPDIRAPAELETACFRIAQEALTNVARHAAARHLWVELRGTEHELAMTIRDDGTGFDPSAARDRAARGAGLGLLGMRERAALLGGRIDIVAGPGEGTLVHVTIPLDRRDP